MRIDLFDFELPETSIALRPTAPRDASRLLVVDPDHAARFLDRHFFELPDFLQSGDLLVFNDTRVIPACLTGRRIRPDGAEAVVSATLHRRVDDAIWRAFVRPAKRLACGDRVIFGHDKQDPLSDRLMAEVVGRGEGGEVVFSFDRGGAALDEAIMALGEMPLPPYISRKRPADQADQSDYQTVYARQPGAVAAPTAGLHFTDTLCSRLAEKGIRSVFVTLHVGAGTFLPVKADDTADHHMHDEWGMIDEYSAALIEDARLSGARIVAVGTTALRLLESAVDETGRITPFHGTTDIFITPGYHFRCVDLLITNFHLPRSTLFMLVCAFTGIDRMKAAYAHAIAHGYRFYSYGDACLLSRVSEER